MAGRTRLGRLAPLTTHVFNPVMRLFAGRVPGLGMLTHTGRSTGRAFPIPVLVFRSGDRFTVALWYGSEVQWVMNIFAAGGCTLRLRGHDVRLIDPELFSDPTLRPLPMPLRLGGRLVGLTEFVRLRAA